MTGPSVLEQVNELAQQIAGQGDLSRTIRAAIERSKALCEADGAALLLVDNATGELYFDAVAGDHGQRAKQIRLAPGQGVAGKVAAQSTPLCVPDVALEPAFDARADLATGFRTRSIIAVPLVLGGDLVGVLEAVRTDQRPSFGPVELHRLELLAPHVAIAVHNGKMMKELRDAQAHVLEANERLEARVRERARQIIRGKREWEKTFDAIAEPLALQDGFVIRRANLAYARRAGVPVQTLKGKSCHELLAARATPCEKCPLLAGPDRRGVAEVPMKANSIFQVSTFNVDLDADRSMVVHYRDVTHERTLEDRLRETERLAAVGQLASGAAHEINNPLGFLMANLQTLGNVLEELSAHRQDSAAWAHVMSDCGEMVKESLEGAQRVAQIVRGLRELSRLEMDSKDASRVLDCLTRSVRAELPPDLSVSLEVPASLVVKMAPLPLDQVMRHLLRNARQAVTAQGHIRVRAWADQEHVVIEVQDDGVGIPKENLGHVFEPFFTTRGIGQGVGLGLTAAWGIVARFGGRIEVRSEPGRGATFTVCLPAGSLPGAAAAEPAENRAQA